MGKRLALTVCLVCVLGCGGKKAPEAESSVGEPGVSPAGKQLAVAEAVASSLVRVEFELKYDKGTPPTLGAWSPYASWRSGAATFVREKRPMETGGFLLSADTVLVSDPMVHPRFVKSIAVVYGEKRVKADPSGYAHKQDGMFLKLAEPLEGAKPLVFEPGKVPPYHQVTYAWRNGAWSIAVTPLPTDPQLDERGEKHTRATPSSLIVDAEGTPVGVALNWELPLDDSWKGSPLDWARYSADEMAEILARVEKKASQALPRVRLSFRSPKKESEEPFSIPYRRSGDTETERDVVGVLLDERRVLVLAYLEPSATARLESIVVHPLEGDPVEAKFTCSLDDYGALVATLDELLPGAGACAAGDIRDLKNELLIYVDLTYRGEERIAYYGRQRFTHFRLGRERRIFPSSRGEGHLYAMKVDGTLVSIPLPFREKVADTHDSYDPDSIIVPMSHLVEVMKDPTAHADASNVPLTEEEENRLAWLGVELQPLNPQLARASKVSELTQSGETGALVSYVYPESPAGKAGIQAGYILLRLHVEGEPAPVEIRAEDTGRRLFPWSRLSTLPEQYFDRIPHPWPSAENAFTRMLTNLGLRKKYTAEFFSDGKIIRKDFVITESPRHYDTAARCKSKVLGVTVRDMTFETLRYFRRKPTDPGVILSKILPGSKASVSGLKPFEIITHINDQPLHSVKDFEGLAEGKGEIRLSVLRMTETRIVKIKLEDAKEKEEEKKH
ncbi:MAG: hypothetical protein AMS16_04780 [Planctomycetes bacterium DG_58]|nr:MAG: hypothetical protein AMS16_04780 [Planctomycetes bacterium DG_58]